MKTIILLLTLSIAINAKNYNTNTKTIAFIQMMETQYGYKKSYLQKLFADVKIQKTPLKIFSRKKNKSTPALQKKYPLHGAWDRYVQYKITNKRVKQGKSFLKKYHSTFKKVEKDAGIGDEEV